MIYITGEHWGTRKRLLMNYQHLSLLWYCIQVSSHQATILSTNHFNYYIVI